jgi:pimeloyl-ACP methyl ester carboxylesterase
MLGAHFAESQVDSFADGFLRPAITERPDLTLERNPMFPFSILRTIVLAVVAFAVVGIGGYLLYDWYYYDRERPQFYWALGLLAFAIGGKWPVRLLLRGFAVNPQPKLPQPIKRRIPGYQGTALQLTIYPLEGRPVFVLTHGWSLNSSVWKYATEELTAKGELVLWDLRGLGDSARPSNNDYSLEAMTEDLAAVVRQFTGRPVVLVGHSIGGMICQTFCRLHPEMMRHPVTGIVLIETTFTNPVKTARGASLWTALQKPLIEPLLYLTIGLAPLVRLSNVLSYLNGSVHLTTRITSFSGAQTWDQLDLACRLSSFAPPAVVARGMLAMLRFDEQATLGGISVPTAVIGGVNDRLTTIEANQHLAHAIPRGRFVSLEPAGHLSILERSQAVAEEIAACRQIPAKLPLSETA